MKTMDVVLNFIKSSKFYGLIFVIVISLILYKMVENFFDKAVVSGKNELEKKKRQTVIILFKNILKYAICLFAILIILNIYGVDTTSLIAGLGIAGVVMGLALQDALKDIISGINIIMDNYYVVGDLVEFNGFTGTIYEFGLKTTKIKSASGQMYVVANRNIDKIINISQKKSVIYLKVPTAYECDHKLIEKVLSGVLDKLKKEVCVDNTETKYLGIDELDKSSINYLIQIKCFQGEQFRIRRLALLYIKEAYEKNNIKIPYEQVEVHNGKKI